jgi:hypothetical protein
LTIKAKIATFIVILGFAVIAAFLMRSNVRPQGDCEKQGELLYAIEPFADVSIATLPGYRDCVENVVEFSTTQGIDLKVTDPAVLCKCINMNIRGMRKKYSSAIDQCLMFRAIESIQRQCHLLAKKQ